MPNVWRLRMMSGKTGVDVVAARAFAIREGIVGAGWGPVEEVDLLDGCRDPDEYLRVAKREWPDDGSMVGALDIFGRKMQIGDYCWIYVTGRGEYYCARIDGDFVYRVGGEFTEHDLHMVRDCTWRCAGTVDAVPGVIRRAFAGPFGTISQIVTGVSNAISASELLFGINMPRTGLDFYAAASPDDLEDVVSLYLQDQGWRVIPSTSKSTMANYEFIMVHNETSERAGVQVKSGNVGYLNQVVAEDLDVFFVLLANDSAVMVGDSSKLRRLDPIKIRDFARDHWSLLPRRLQAQWPQE